MKLQQIILISKEAQERYNERELQKYIAKGPLKLLTRAFESSAQFMGRDESKHFNSVVTDWIDNQDCDMKILSSPSDDINQTHLWTAEMMGIPSVHVFESNEEGADLVLTVIGPADPEEMQDFLLDTEDY